MLSTNERTVLSTMQVGSNLALILDGDVPDKMWQRLKANGVVYESGIPFYRPAGDLDFSKIPTNEAFAVDATAEDIPVGTVVTFVGL